MQLRAEIIATEETYVESLRTLKREFADPMKEAGQDSETFCFADTAVSSHRQQDGIKCVGRCEHFLQCGVDPNISSSE